MMNKIYKKLLTIIFMPLLAILVGCSANNPSKSYFQLTSNLQSSVSQKIKTTKYFIWIESVDVVSFLNKPGIVLQTDNIKYETATHHLWASTLSQQLQERLTQDLTVMLPNYLVSSRSITTPTLTVKLFIDGFHGSYTGDAVIKGRWVVTDSKNNIESKPFERYVPLASNGYDALVNALSKGWQDEELDFANSIKL
ncbi:MULTISPECIES: PqiC family protein [unclassified Gilliamella]|uniref:PqiC family protein n=2 Tax=Gilliamella TaxID=1193503 RepID=UPI0009B861C8|nr:ABC-type transport auxiliary lipoprotein family protein [Gilliamella apicola]